MATDDNWAEYWRDEGAGGEVFVDRNGQPHPDLARFWQARTATLAAGASVIDLACGAGSVLSHAAVDGAATRSATDLSHPALARLRERLPGVAVFVADAARLPLADGSFDLVISQFGIEYAGIVAFEAAARIVAPKGRLEVLCHIAGGYIDHRNTAQQHAIALARESRFIAFARDVATALYSGSRSRVDAATAAFRPAEQALARLVASGHQGVASHLYLGFRQMVERYRHYDPADFTGWLNAMEADLARHESRIRTMRAAALGADDVARVRERIAALGLTGISVDPFRLGGHDRDLAWHIAAERP